MFFIVISVVTIGLKGVRTKSKERIVKWQILRLKILEIGFVLQEKWEETTHLIFLFEIKVKMFLWKEIYHDKSSFLQKKKIVSGII